MNRKSPPFASRRELLLSSLALPLLAACSAGDDSAAIGAGGQRTIRADAMPVSLREVIDSLFAESDEVGETRALLILRNGKAFYEGYGAGFGPDTRLLSWSMAKTVTATLIGMLVADGRLALTDPAPIPDWQRPGDPRGSITLQHLLHMASGLEHVENADPLWESDTVTMLFGAGANDMAAMAEAKPPIAVPGEIFTYSTATTVILSDIIARSLTQSGNATVRRDAVRNFVDGRLGGPLQMHSLLPEFDAAGTMIGGSIMHATARDYGKFGEFLRRRGQTPEGTSLVPDSWIDFMLTPSPTNPAYGGHLWLNRRPKNGDAPLWPAQGPSDIFACLGHQGQFIVVSPRQNMTVVRLGVSTRPQIDAVRDRLAAIFKVM